eukprot:m51a1_g9316 hypothetical protein (354) ;mRNA; f:119058-120119
MHSALKRRFESVVRPVEWVTDELVNLVMQNEAEFTLQLCAGGYMSEDAVVRLFLRSKLVPSSATRAAILRESGVVVCGLLDYGAKTGANAFFRGLDGTQPLVVKVGRRVAHEAKVLREVHQRLGSVPTMPPYRPIFRFKDGFQALALPMYSCTIGKYVEEQMGEEPSERMAGAAEKTAIGIAVCVLASLEALHSVGYSHGDIKPCNIALAPDSIAVLIDYGSARRFGKPLRSFTPGYGLDVEPRASIQYDCTCLATTVFQVATRLFPQCVSTVSCLRGAATKETVIIGGCPKRVDYRVLCPNVCDLVCRLLDARTAGDVGSCLHFAADVGSKLGCPTLAQVRPDASASAIVRS